SPLRTRLLLRRYHTSGALPYSGETHYMREGRSLMFRPAVLSSGASTVGARGYSSSGAFISGAVFMQLPSAPMIRVSASLSALPPEEFTDRRTAGSPLRI